MSTHMSWATVLALMSKRPDMIHTGRCGISVVPHLPEDSSLQTHQGTIRELALRLRMRRGLQGIIAKLRFHTTLRHI